MRLLVACLLMVISAWGSAKAEGNFGDLQELAQWVGKYPADEINGKTVWTNKDLNVLVNEVLHEKSVGILYDDLAKGPTSPIERQGDVLRITACRAHECIFHATTMFVDLKRNTLSMCWVNSYDEHDTWLQVGKKPLFLSAAECWDYKGFEAHKKFFKE